MLTTSQHIPTHMRAMLLTGFGGTDKLQYRDDVPVPTPGPHQVLIEVGACGVNNTDVWTREGAYGASEEAGWQGSAFTFPRIQGMDAVGRIVALGQGVPPERLGQRVMVNPTLYAPVAGAASLYQATYLGSDAAVRTLLQNRIDVGNTGGSVSIQVSISASSAVATVLLGWPW